MTRRDYYTISRALNRLKKRILLTEDKVIQLREIDLFEFLLLNLIESIKEDNPEFIESRFRDLIGN